MTELLLQDMARNLGQVKIHGALGIAAPSPRHCAAVHKGADVEGDRGQAKRAAGEGRPRTREGSTMGRRGEMQLSTVQH